MPETTEPTSPETRQAWLAGYQFALTHLGMSLDYGPWEPSGHECGDIAPDAEHADCEKPVMQRAVTAEYLSTRVALGVELEEHARHAEGGEGELRDRAVRALYAHSHPHGDWDNYDDQGTYLAAADAVIAALAPELDRRTSGDVGRCGAHAPRLIPANGIKSAFCALPADHAGWHRADDGCEWSAAADHPRPTALTLAARDEHIAELEAENERLREDLACGHRFHVGPFELYQAHSEEHADTWTLVSKAKGERVEGGIRVALARARQLTQEGQS